MVPQPADKSLEMPDSAPFFSKKLSSLLTAQVILWDPT